MAPKIVVCEQDSPQWWEARRGIPTASMFSAILAKGEGKTRRAYLYRLAAEIVTGEQGESFTSQAMERGKVLEAEARRLYAFLNSLKLERIGIALNFGAGASPDSLIGKDGGLEIKTQRADLLVETIFKDQFPPEHMAQVQGNLWVTEREWWDLVIYWPKMPPFVKRIGRDKAYIATLAGEVERFQDELAQAVDRLQRYGEAA